MTFDVCACVCACASASSLLIHSRWRYFENFTSNSSPLAICDQIRTKNDHVERIDSYFISYNFVICTARVCAKCAHIAYVWLHSNTPEKRMDDGWSAVAFPKRLLYFGVLFIYLLDSSVAFRMAFYLYEYTNTHKSIIVISIQTEYWVIYAPTDSYSFSLLRWMLL